MNKTTTIDGEEYVIIQHLGISEENSHCYLAAKYSDCPTYVPSAVPLHYVVTRDYVDSCDENQ